MSAEQTASQVPGQKALVDPTDYSLKGDGVTISYSSTSISGRPLFQYSDGTQNLSFAGDEINRVETPAGTLVTVTLEPNNDAREIKLSLLVPIIRLHTGGETLTFKTIAIRTADSSGAFTLPPGPAGVLQVYRVLKLEGTAAFNVS